MVTLEASVRVLESEGVSARWVESRKTTNKFANGLLRILAMIRQGYLKKTKQNKTKQKNFACLQIWTSHLEMSATPYFNVTCNWYYFKALYHSIHVSLSI